jgi:penicillin-binding protein-related factor A (putative recombinase)
MIHDRTNIAFRGRELEDEIQATFAYYKLKGIAKIYKFPISTKVKEGGRIYYAEKTGFDFVGHWIKGSRTAIYIEAKDSQTKKKLPLLRWGQKTKEFGLSARQLVELYENESHGCDAFVVWRMNGISYRLSPSDLMETVHIGYEVIPEKHSAIMKKLNVVDGLIDFLNILSIK